MKPARAIAIGVVMAGIVATFAFGNQLDNAWHVLRYGYDRISFETRHYISPRTYTGAVNQLHATGRSYYGLSIFVPEQEYEFSQRMHVVPGMIVVKKGSNYEEYELSGGQ